jgi:hypothetical protein
MGNEDLLSDCLIFHAKMHFTQAAEKVSRKEYAKQPAADAKAKKYINFSLRLGVRLFFLKPQYPQTVIIICL